MSIRGLVPSAAAAGRSEMSLTPRRRQIADEGGRAARPCGVRDGVDGRSGRRIAPRRAACEVARRQCRRPLAQHRAAVLAEARRPADAPRRVPDAERRAGKRHGASQAGMLDRHEEAALGEVRIRRAAPPARGPRRTGCGGAARPRTAPRPCSGPPTRRGRRRCALPARWRCIGSCISGSSMLGAEAVGLHPLDERRPVAERAVHHPAVLAAADAEEPRPVQRALTPRDPAVLVEEPGHVLERRRDRRLQAHVDVLAATRSARARAARRARRWRRRRRPGDTPADRASAAAGRRRGR